MLFLLFRLLPCPFFCTVEVGSFCIFHIRCGPAFLFLEQYACKAKMDRQKAKIAYKRHNIHMQETNYVLVTILFSETELISVYISFTTEKTMIFFIFTGLGFYTPRRQKTT